MNLNELRRAMKQDAWHLLPASFTFSIDLYEWHDSSLFKKHVTELIAWVRSHGYNVEEWRDERTHRLEFQFEHQHPHELARCLLERSGLNPSQRPSTPLRSATVREWANPTLGAPWDGNPPPVATITTDMMQHYLRAIQRHMIESTAIPRAPVIDNHTPAQKSAPPPPPSLLFQARHRRLSLPAS